VRAQTDLLSLNRTSLYYTPVAPAPEQVALKHRIDTIATDRPYYGIRRITAQLRREGMLVNHKAVARHMREMGLAAIYPGPNLSKRAQQAAIYPYLLRHVPATRPNHIWGIDITYIRLRGGWMYLVAVLDWFSRYIVSWELDQTLAQPFVMAAVQRALAQATRRSGTAIRAAISPVRSTPVSCWRRASRSVWTARVARWTTSLLNGCGGV